MSRTKVPADLRQRVSEQVRHRCGYCLTREEVVGCPREIDHLIPESLGGPTEEHTLWLACSLSNDHKSDRITALDTATGEVVRLFNPRRQKWAEHFEWIEGDAVILGLTPAGRATVLALNLNRPPLIVARRLWVSVGWHPPRDGGPP